MLTHAEADAPIMCACGNCDWKGPDTDTEEIRDFWSRVEVGGEIPVGDCPECEAFVYLDRPGVREAARKAIVEIEAHWTRDELAANHCGMEVALDGLRAALA